MDKKYVINITKTTILNLPSEEEAESIANILVGREQKDFLGNAMFITTDIKELTNAT